MATISVNKLTEFVSYVEKSHCISRPMRWQKGSMS